MTQHEREVVEQPEIIMAGSQRYQAPEHEPWFTRRLRVVPLFLIINFLVFLGWRLSDSEVSVFFIRNFLVSTLHLKEGLIWTLVTSVFSHNQTLHFFFNMIVLYSFGGILERFLGARRFIVFYLTAGVVASLSHCLVSTFLLGQDIPALGASGSLAGLLAVFAFLFPRQRILLFGLIPIPAIVALILFVGLDVMGLVAQEMGCGLPIGHGAHLGGTLCGLIFYFYYLRPKLHRIRYR